MVSPATFRHPAVLAKAAVSADHISGGRVDALEEQLQIVRGHWAEGPFSFEGEHFRAKDLDARPKPVQSPLPLILGGRGGPRSLRLAARYADESNTVMATAEEVAEIRERLDRASRLSSWQGENGDGDALIASMRESTILGTVPEAIEHLRRLEAAGLTRVMGQHLLHRDLDAIALLGDEVIPGLAR